MASRPEITLPAALAVGTLVWAIHSRGLPASVDVRAASEPGDEMLETVRKRNAWMSAAVVAGISLIAKDHVIFIVGGLMVVALDIATRIDIWTDPNSNKVESGVMPQSGPGNADAETDVGNVAYIA